MTWVGQVRLGQGFAVFSGRADSADLHRHAAYQVILSPTGNVRVSDPAGLEIGGGTVLIRPNTLHAVRTSGAVTIVYLDLRLPLASELARQAGPEPIAVLPDGVPPFMAGLSLDDIAAELMEITQTEAAGTNDRLQAAMTALDTACGALSIAKAAQKAGISDSHLRRLAREQLGLPLSSWLIWRKLERAVSEIANGASLSEGAVAGGFADQAHFTREMRRMFGITPGTAEKVLRPRLPAAPA